ncbi:uncharacterized protein IUM83_16690 [Phytophthora cinnamomi]|uniref:uncharacterized protein n=1 Tax=Phytophthora cinnamomi TaxID=4785 RepID=UPI0035596220|nr:hypothetical protein IUM83_16690 [Phytophthora cinnamomi]
MVKAKDEDEEELREEALAEWVSRGQAAQDFTMEKMMKLWDAEDDGNEEEDEEGGLEDKQELMKGYQMLGPLVDQAKDAAHHYKEIAMVEGKKALVTAWKYAELPPLRDRRLLRQHVVHVHEMDAETMKYSKIHERVREDLDDARQMEEELHFGLKKRNKRQAPLLNRFQELKAEADRVQHEQVLEEIQQRRRERVDKAMQEKKRLLEEKERKAEQLLVQRRQRNMKFWQKQLVEAREFAEQQTYEQERKEEFDRQVEEMQEEIRMVEEEESIDAKRSFERLQTMSSIGIFDTAYEPGEWNSSLEGGNRTGLDEYTTGVSTTRGFIIENEQKRIKLLEIQSKVTMLREKLEQVEQAKTNLGLNMRTILERKDYLLQEIRQVRAEQDGLNEVLAGPPRRDPSEHEKQQFHTLVTRRAAYMKQLGDLDSRIANIQKRTEIVHRSEASFLPMLKEAEEKLVETQAQVDAIEKERHELPVVVGRAIFQPEGALIPTHGEEADRVSVQMTKPFIDPTTLLNQVTMESKFEILKSAVAPVTEHYKKAKTQAIEAWKVNELRSLAEQDLDSAKARLVKILRTGDLTFEFSGYRLCFCLEITHRGVADLKRKTLRYALSNSARYEERLENFREEENHARLLQKEKHFVSELVKTMRMQSKKTSSQRATELLQELIQVERSTTKMWDSTLFHGHFQRFKRAEYVNMLRGEIKKEIAVQIDYSIALRQGRVSESEMLAAGTPVITDNSLQGKRKEVSRTLRRTRREEAETRLLLVAKDAKIEQLQQETKKNVQEENEAAIREAKEDNMLSQQMQQELARREKLFYADAIRLTTYNEAVSSQIDFQVQRKLNVLQQTMHAPVNIDPIVHDLKESFARQFVQGKLALVRKTWERKMKRVTNKRTKTRKEREFRIRQEEELMKEVNESNERELAALKSNQEQRAKEELLRIPNFQAAIEQAFECEHLELKAWGTKYDFGMKCKKCGKEMSKSCDDPNHACGGDPALDEDVRIHRAQATSGIAFRFMSAEHLHKVEKERLRLEKEARSIEDVEAMLYDRLDPKSIDDFNYRHGINRGTLLENADSSDPLYPRLVQDIHRASHQDEILFHGRLRNFNFRIQQIFRQHAEGTRRLEIQRAFLENAHRENELVLMKLPLIEADHARAVALIAEDAAVLTRFEETKVALTAAQREREAAYYAIEGVEEEAEFSEFHAPALIKSSDEMSAIYKRIQGEFDFAKQQLTTAKDRLDKAENERSKVDSLMNRLYCRTQNSILRTKYGFMKVKYYRTEDSCVVVSPLHWDATLFIPMDEILAYEAIYREEESFSMADEDERAHEFIRAEREMELVERKKMEIEDNQIRGIVAWRAKKEKEETLLTNAICHDELESQFIYEMEGRKSSIESARQEALHLQRRGRVYPPRRRPPLTQRPSRFDAKRVSRASEKRLAMAVIEQQLLAKEKKLRDESLRERNAISVASLAREVYGELLAVITREICVERTKQGKHEAHELLRAKRSAVIVASDQARAPSGALVAPLLGLDRLWVSRKQKYTLLYSTWRQEYAKLQLVRDEMARRDELRRLAEEERLRHEARRKEMLVEERLCRKFYLEEMVLCMQERKAMTSAEVEMREYIRQLELEAMKTKYSKMVEDRNRVNDKAARRLEIKLGKNEQHRLHREWRQIKVEDELSMQIREKEIADALAEALERQFDKYVAHQLAQGKVSAELEASRMAERLREAQQVAMEKRRAFENKTVQERMIATVETFYALSKAEVEWMDAIERAKFWEQRVPPLEANLKQMLPELKRIQEERENVVNDAKSKREYADKCKKRIEEADTSLSRAIQEKEKAMLRYKRVHKLNATIDSEVLHDRVQRFRTSYLRDRLHVQYFALLTDAIVRRALVECSEREIVRLQEQTKQLEEERRFKSKEVSVLQRKRRRALRMRLRRAELNKFIFGHSRRRLLKDMFQRWTKLWCERTRVRASFKMKHELLLQKQKLTMTTSSPLLKQQSLKYSEEQNNRYSCTYHPGMYEFACVRTSQAVPADSICLRETTPSSTISLRRQQLKSKPFLIKLISNYSNCVRGTSSER